MFTQIKLEALKLVRSRSFFLSFIVLTGFVVLMLCIRPVSRVSLLLSKFLVVAFYTYLLVAFFIGLNLLVGLFFVGWGDLQLYPGALNIVDEPGKLLRDEALLRFAYASLSGTWALLVIAAIAMLVSVLFDN